MKNLKRILILTLVFALCASLFTVAYAKSDKHDKGRDRDNDNDTYTTTDLSEDLQILKTLGLLIGEGKDGLTLEYTHSKPTRIQGFVIYLRLINLEKDADKYTFRKGDDNFDDRDGCSDYVKNKMGYAKKHPELNWVGSNGKFNPMARLTAKEYAKIMLTALDYKYDADFSWKNVESFAESHGLNVPEGDFTIAKLAEMTVQTLYLNMKNSSQTLIGYLASVNPEFAAKVALLGTNTTTDTLKPTVTDVLLTSPYTYTVSSSVTIYFSEAIKNQTLTNTSLYTVDLDGSAGAYTTTSLLAMNGTATATSDQKSVTLTIPGLVTGGESAVAGVTTIGISGQKDLAGNMMDPISTFVRRAAVLSAVSAAAIDVNTLQVTFNNPMKTIDTTEFKLYRSDGVTLASVGTSYVLDATGKTVTLTMGGALTAAAYASTADTTTAKLAIGAAVTRDIFGNAVSGAAAVSAVSFSTPATVMIADKIAPSVASLNPGTAAYTFDIVFSEPVNVSDTATLAAAVKVTTLGGAAKTANYAFSGSAGNIAGFTKLTVTIVSGADNHYNIELLGQGIKDISGNTVKAFAKTTITVPTL